jgi:hypothetical protein
MTDDTATDAGELDEGSPDDEPDVADADLPADEEEEADPPPDDDSATPVDPDEEEGAG